MLLGKYTLYMEKLHEVFNYDEESGLIKLKSDNSEIGSIKQENIIGKIILKIWTANK